MKWYGYLLYIFAFIFSGLFLSCGKEQSADFYVEYPPMHFRFPQGLSPFFRYAKSIVIPNHFNSYAQQLGYNPADVTEIFANEIVLATDDGNLVHFDEWEEVSVFLIHPDDANDRTEIAFERPQPGYRDFRMALLPGTANLWRFFQKDSLHFEVVITPKVVSRYANLSLHTRFAVFTQ